MKIWVQFLIGRIGFFREYGEGSGNNRENNSETVSESETDKESDLSGDTEEHSERFHQTNFFLLNITSL